MRTAPKLVLCLALCMSFCTVTVAAPTNSNANTNVINANVVAANVLPSWGETKKVVPTTNTNTNNVNTNSNPGSSSSSPVVTTVTATTTTTTTNSNIKDDIPNNNQINDAPPTSPSTTLAQQATTAAPTSFLPPTSNQVQLANVEATKAGQVTVYSQCADDGLTPLAQVRSGVISSFVVARSSQITVQWSDNTSSTRSLCHTSLYTTEQDAATSKCSVHEPLPLKAPVTPSIPLFGFAEPHLHMFVERGALGRLMYGQADGDIASAMHACDGSSKHGLGMYPKFPSVDQILKRALSCDGQDFPTHPSATEGYPSFSSWPRWNDVVHHQAHVSWLKKSFDDGLRLVVISVVSNQLLCEFTEVVGLAPHPDLPATCADWENNQAQLTRARQVIAANPDWMDLALSSQHAKTIIESGRLAVVLAVESGDILPERRDGQSVSDWVAQALKPYYDAGVRSLQLVHEFSDQITGASVQTEIYNLLSEMSSMTTGSGDDKNKQILSKNPAAQTLSQLSEESQAATTPKTEADNKADHHRDQQSSPSSSEAFIAATKALGTTLNLQQDAISALLSCPLHVLDVVQKLNVWAKKHKAKLDGYKLATDPDSGVQYNTLGLNKEVGREFVSQALKLGMIVDAAHISRAGGADLASLLKEKNAPYFVSHGFFATKFEHTDYNVDAKVVSWILETGGILGLRTVATEFPTYPFTKVPNDCDGSIKSYLQAHQLALSFGLKTAITSDFNGLAINLAPRFGLPEETCAEPWIREGCLARESQKQQQTNASPTNSEQDAQLAAKCDKLKQRRDTQRLAQGDKAVNGTNTAYDVKGLASMEFLGRALSDARSLGLPMDSVLQSAGEFVSMWNQIDHTISPATPNTEKAPTHDMVVAAMNCWCAGCQ